MPSSSTSPVLLAVKDDIAAMRTRGAGEIGKEAARALAKAAAQYDGTDVRAFRQDIIEAARLLASARPTAVSLRNGLNRVLAAGMRPDDVPGAQKAVTQEAEALARTVDEARAKIADLGQSYLEAGDTVLTHCHSTVAGAVLARAVAAGKRLRVFATETRPFGQGLITVRQLAEHGVAATLIVDSAAYHVMKTQDVTKVVVGADTVAADGALYNKIGTSQVALAANVLGIPFYVACESYKFSPYTLNGEAVPIEERDPAEVARAEDLPETASVFNPVFDRTPPELVTMYLTETGPVKPEETADFVRRTFGEAEPWV